MTTIAFTEDVMTDYSFVSRTPIYKVHKLNREEFNDYKKCLTNLIQISKFEELYDQIVQSHLEYKTFLYESLIKFSSMNGLLENQSYDYKLKANRLLCSTLNFAKFYLDKSYKEERSFISKLTGNKQNNRSVKLIRERLFNESDAYAIGESLRNYAQHHSLLIDSFTFGFHEKTLLFYSCLDKNKFTTFIRARGQSKATLDRLLNAVEKNCYQEKGVDLHKVIDEFVYSIGKIHEHNREEYRGIIADSYSKLDQLVNVFPESKYYELKEGETRIIMNFKRIKRTIDYICQKQAFTIPFHLFETTTYPPNKV
ncbi:hypothetical protein LZP69_00405 [Shewanella sp. AS1]|uniref:hypothetical protein n=1 Tax=Shewanella sp. AS1 TaxID=2907626 RepID=UPI001F450758|nr:hypothetical protein [Shewanella sp. AS1]MCE9677652.1 hypothetical protein [Shewanella sp. AS1]